jgi:alginate O-acetyltransferase complex protein AlgI
MLATTSIDFLTAQRIADSPAAQRKKLWLVVSMASNLGVLAVFKYYDFFADSVNAVAGAGTLPLLHLILPIGISFYTFESMSYTIDVYREEVAPLRRFIDYAHFVTMFPRLVAGPIVRYRDLSVQLMNAPRKLDVEHVPEALHFLAIGMAKKVLIADNLAHRLVDPSFNAAHSLAFVEGWSSALGYTAQLYFDFSGYSDMAVGLGLLVGFRLPRNFALPYASKNPSEFWRRWHISLSTWLRDYLYISLGGNRASPARTKFNLFMTMLLGGLWHGANWTFVAWGAYHGLALVFYNRFAKNRRPLPRFVSIGLTFLVVVIGWVLFRADSLHQAGEVLAAMAGTRGVGLGFVRGHLTSLGLLAVALALSFTIDTPELWEKIALRTQRHRLVAAADALLFVLCLTRLAVPSPFLYFQF